MTQSANAIRLKTHQIREYINNPRKHYELRQNKALFFQLCSSLDVVGDTEEAIIAFENKEFGESIAAQYLAVYGFLQAIYVQQDAVDCLCESLFIPEKINRYPKLTEIRRIRHDTVGHPTKRDKPKSKPITFNFISRFTENMNFTLVSFTGDGNSQARDVNIPGIIVEQRKYITEILSTIVTNLEAEEKAHKERFRMEKLSMIFSDSLVYNFEKIFEGIYREDFVELAAGHLEIVHEMAQNFREAVGRRNMDYYDSLNHDYSLIEHAITRLKNYCSSKANGEKSEIDKPTAEIFAIYLREQIANLRQQAREIDEDYANN